MRKIAIILSIIGCILIFLGNLMISISQQYAKDIGNMKNKKESRKVLTGKS